MKIVIEAMHGLGDVVCMIPMMKEIRESYRDAEITVLVNNKGSAEILKCARLNINDFVEIKAHANKQKAFWQCISLRKRKYDLAIACANTPVLKSYLLMGLIHAQKTVGIQFEDKVNFDGLHDRFHFVDAHLMAIHKLGLPVYNYYPQIFPDPDIVKQYKEKLPLAPNKKTVGICIGRADISYRNRRRTQKVYTRGWGNFNEHVRNMSTLISLLLKEHCQVVLIGGPGETGIKDAVIQKMSFEDTKSIVSMVGKTTVSESIALLSLCDISVGVDTGMQHIADALGIRTVSLFGPTNPKTHGAYSNKAAFVEVNVPCKYCYGTPKYVFCENRICMSQITPEMVMKKVKEQLNKFVR